jgi:E3 ubiquitin-protein ligase BRE1
VHLEKENAARYVALETHKQKAIESTQLYHELLVKTEKSSSKLMDLQQLLREKTEQLEKEIYAKKRVQEEGIRFRKKLDFHEQFSTSGDENLKEQLQMYKQLLKCSSCHIRDKEVVLTRCFHVFCKDCIDLRINTRQRKCPSCGDSFGMNDVHLLYL